MDYLVRYYSCCMNHAKYIIENTNILVHDVKKLGTTWYEGVHDEWKETTTVTIT